MNGRICGTILRSCAARFGSLADRPAPTSLLAPLAAFHCAGTACIAVQSDLVAQPQCLQTRVGARPGTAQLQHSPAAASSSQSQRCSSLGRCASTLAAAAPATAAAAEHDRASSSAAASSSTAAQDKLVTPGRAQNTPPPPWTPTRELRKRNFLPRRMGHLMQARMCHNPQLLLDFAFLSLTICSSPRSCLSRCVLTGAGG